MNGKREIAQRNCRCNFCPAIAQMKPNVRWKNEPVQAPPWTHADVESERAGEKSEYVQGVVSNTERIIC